MAGNLSPKLDWPLANPKWAATLNPIIGNPMNNMQLIENIVLQVGSNKIKTGLGKLQHGWIIVDIQGVSSIYRDAPFNETILSLNSSDAVTISLGVF